MNAEKYVGGIVRKVKCSHKKREEIRKEILADVAAREENGEEWTQIRESMGTMEEIAEEFNRNLADGEQRSYRRGKTVKILCSIAAVLLLLGIFVWWWLPKGYPTGYSGYFTQEALEEAAEDVVRLLGQNDFEALKEEAIPQMVPYLTSESIDAIRGELGEDWGEIQGFGNIYTQELRQRGKVFGVAQFNVSYTNVNVTYTLTFDEEMKLAGLYMR